MKSLLPLSTHVVAVALRACADAGHVRTRAAASVIATALINSPFVMRGM